MFDELMNSAISRCRQTGGTPSPGPTIAQQLAFPVGQDVTIVVAPCRDDE